jgi:hypothetical protein
MEGLFQQSAGNTKKAPICSWVPFFFCRRRTSSFGQRLDLKLDIVDVHLNDLASLTFAPNQPFPYPFQNQGLADAELGRGIFRGIPGFHERHCSAPFLPPALGRVRQPLADTSGNFCSLDTLEKISPNATVLSGKFEVKLRNNSKTILLSVSSAHSERRAGRNEKNRLKHCRCSRFWSSEVFAKEG